MTVHFVVVYIYPKRPSSFDSLNCPVFAELENTTKDRPLLFETPSSFNTSQRPQLQTVRFHFPQTVHFKHPCDCLFGTVYFKRSFQVIISLNFAPVLVMVCHVNLLRRFLKLPNKLKQMDFDLKMFYFWELFEKKQKWKFLISKRF